MTDVIAHRGASRVAPQNTVDAFRRAVTMGADAVELDVRPTADGALVVHHDAHLPDGRAIVRTLAADLPADVPTLAEALDASAPLLVNIEVKNAPDEPDFDPTDALAEQVVELLATRRDPRRRWLISSFRLATIDRVRALAPDLATASLVMALDDDAIAAAVAGGHPTIHPWFGAVTAERLRAAHDAGLRVNVWTCNDPDRAAELAGWGVDGVITDVPDEIRAALS